ncbi:MAG: DUF5908 family protein [Bacteroidia bacterium]|nr:DUF5908 family protein [Bacteroidia bacterium]
MPLEIRELVIKAVVAPELQNAQDSTPPETSASENVIRTIEDKRLLLEIVQEMLEKKNER